MADGWTGLKIPALSPLPPNISKPLLVSPPSPAPAVTTSAPFIEESGEAIVVAKRKIRNGRTDGREAKAIFHRCNFSMSIVIGPGVREENSSQRKRAA